MHPAHEAFRQRLCAEHAADERGGVGFAEDVQGDLAIVGPIGPPHGVAGTLRRDQEHAEPRQAVDQEGQVVLGCLVDPVEVLHDEHERGPHAARDGQRSNGLEHLLPLPSGIEGLQRLLRAPAEELAEK